MCLGGEGGGVVGAGGYLRVVVTVMLFGSGKSGMYGSEQTMAGMSGSDW